MAQYITGTAANGDSFYTAVRTAMLANGWTLIDNISDAVNNRQQVFRGGAIDATAQNYVYIEARWTGSYYSLTVYTDWDTTSHTGQHQTGSTSQNSISGWVNFTYHVRVNDFAVGYVWVYSGTYYKGYSGFVRRGLSPAKAGITKTSAAYSAGATVLNVSSDMTAKLKPNQKVVIYNHGGNSGSANWGNAELVQILSLTSTSITLTGPLAYGYDAGAVIGWNPFPGVTMYATSFTTDTSLTTYPYMTFYLDGYWGGYTSQSGYTYFTVFGNEGYNDPGDINLEFTGGTFDLNCTQTGRNGFHGYFYHYECCANGGQIRGDIMDDGTNQYVVVSGGYSSAALILGPM